jgi:hypothetical protein
LRLIENALRNDTGIVPPSNDGVVHLMMADNAQKTKIARRFFCAMRYFASTLVKELVKLVKEYLVWQESFFGELKQQNFMYS